MEDFRWSTDYTHTDNTTTMEEYLEQHLPSNFEVIYQADSYAEIIDKTSGTQWSVHAGGDGDSFNHRIRFEPLYHRMNR